MIGFATGLLMGISGTLGAIGGGTLAGFAHFITYKRPTIQPVPRHDSSVEMLALTSKVVGYGLSVIGGAVTGGGCALTYLAKIGHSGGWHPEQAPTLPVMLSENLQSLSLVGLGLGFIVLVARLANPTSIQRFEIDRH